MSLKFDFKHVKKTTAEYTTRLDGSSMRTSCQRPFLAAFRIIYARYAALATDSIRRAQSQNLEQAERFVDAAQQQEEILSRACRLSDVRRQCESLMQNGDRSAALKCLERFVEQEPDDPETPLALGNLRYQLGDLSGAAHEFERASQQAPQNAPALAQLAMLRVQQDRLAEAEDLARRALALEPRQFDMLQLLAALMLHGGQPEEAHEFYRQMAQQDPKNIEARLGQVRCCIAQDHDVLAQLILEEVLEAHPLHAEACALLAQLEGKRSPVQPGAGPGQSEATTRPRSGKQFTTHP